MKSELTASKLETKPLPKSIVSSPKRYEMRPNLDFKTILTNPYEYASLMLKLNKLSFKDDHYISNALIFRELCSLPSNMSWPMVFDPEDNLGKCVVILQESIERMKTNFSNEAILMDLAENINRAQMQNEEGTISGTPSDLTRESSQISLNDEVYFL